MGYRQKNRTSTDCAESVIETRTFQLPGSTAYGEALFGHRSDSRFLLAAFFRSNHHLLKKMTETDDINGIMCGSATRMWLCGEHSWAAPKAILVYLQSSNLSSENV
jgi:hypothetical protein